MAEKEEKKEGYFAKLFKKSPKFFNNKKSVAEFKEKEKDKIDAMVTAAKELLREKRESQDVTMAQYDGDKKEEIYLYDFLKEYNNNGTFMIDGGTTTGTGFGGAFGVSVNSDSPPMVDGGNPPARVAVSSEIMDKKETAKRYKPIDVWQELEKIPDPILLEDLDDKIMVLKLKKDFIRYNPYAKKEVIDMITRLENRKKYNEHKEFFEKFDNTSTDKINDLINKYKLVLKQSDLFIPKFPKDAMLIMKEYEDRTKEICGKKPVFYVIAEVAMFKEEEKRNDPILLAQSPFGMFWNILGAWDKELILLEEL